jgi:hypothetical protein
MEVKMRIKLIGILSLYLLVLMTGSLFARDAENQLSKQFHAALQSPAQQSSARQNAIPYADTRDKNFWIAFSELIALQLIPNYFNWRVADDSTAVLSWDAWDRNVRGGFEWDPNDLTTNMYAHPFHGAMFFNTARSNGYDFWESAPWAFAGSFIWEFFGENNRGAINDWAMTSFGGITIGEGLHRAASLLLDNQARGAERAFRELGAFLINPVKGFNRAVKGEMTKIGPNPLEKYPKSLNTFGFLGLRTFWDVQDVGGERTREETGSFIYFGLDLNYGDPMHDYTQPFDAFRLTFQLNGKNQAAATGDTTASFKTGIGQLQVHGTVYGKELKQTDKVRHAFTMDMLFDYANNQTYEFGGQAIGFGLRSRWGLSQNQAIQTIIQPSLIVMGAVDNPRYQPDPTRPLTFENRRYDFGSGLGLRVLASYVKNGYTYFRIGYRGFFQHTVNGDHGNQMVQFLGAMANYPIWRRIGIGAEFLVYQRDTWYKYIPEEEITIKDQHSRNPELRLNLTFFW